MKAAESEIISHRLHWSSLLFDIASHVWSYLIPIGLGLMGAARGDLLWTLIAAFFFFMSLLRSVLRFFTLDYSIIDRNLVVRQGLLVRNIRTVPLKRVQNIDLVQNPFHRWFNVAEVKIETAAGAEPEAVLRVLGMPQIDRLRDEIFRKQFSGTRPGMIGLESESEAAHLERSETGERTVNSDSISSESLIDQGDQNHREPGFESPASGEGFPDKDQQGNEHAVTLLAIPNRWFILAGLASNRGLILLWVFLGLLYQLADQANWLDNLDLKRLAGWLPEDWGQKGWFLTALIGVGLGLMFLKIMGVCWYVWRFSGYSLTRRGEDLRISCGLLTRVSATIPRSRIQFISVRQDWIARWFGFCSIRIETAGGGKNQSADESVSGRWFLPVMPYARLPEILPELRQQLEWTPDCWEWHLLSKQAFSRMLRKGVLLALLSGLIGAYFWNPWGGLAGLLVLSPICLWLKAVSRSVRYARFAGGVAHQQGVINRLTNLTFFEKIQTIQFSSSPFDRKWKMANLSIDTAGAGPAESRISLRMLDSEFALEERERLREIAALHPTGFQ
jgi:putative membrane protein